MNNGSAYHFTYCTGRNMECTSCGNTIEPEIVALRDIGYYVDAELPPGTLEVWQDGKRIGRIENIGIRCTCHSEPMERDGKPGLRLIQCPKCAAESINERSR